jgi:hypothetical protein
MANIRNLDLAALKDVIERILRKPFSSRKKIRKASRLFVESLEDRTVPSTFMVNELSDTHAVNLISGVDSTGHTSLRSAVEAADHLGGDQTIQFDPGVFAAPQTITLTNFGLTLKADITIQGPAAGVTISGDHAHRVFVVDAGTQANLTGLTLSDGKIADYGGGILNNGALTLNNCTVSRNFASGAEYCYGGGIYNNGTLTITNSVIADNAAYTYTYYYYIDDPSDPPFLLSYVEGDAGGIFNNGSVTLTDSTISGNIAAINGGGVFNNVHGTANLTNSSVIGNTFIGAPAGAWENNGSDPQCNGGGIFNDGAASVTSSTISGNSAFSGGGIYSGGALMVADSIIAGNNSWRGGGIFNAATATLIDSIISGNTATQSGGGVLSGSYATTVLNRCNLSDNSAAGGGAIGCPYYYCPVTITDCTISGNKATDSGGGIFGNGPNEVTLQDSTISGNTAVQGGGIFWGGYWTNDLTLTNCTISANTATQDGGGVYISSGNSYGLTGTLSDATLSSSTIAGNTAAKGSGIFNAGSLTLDNSIVAANTSQAGDGDLVGAVLSSSVNNLIGDGTGITSGISNNVNGNQVGTHTAPIDPLLAQLGNYGGLTQSMALLPGSPAIDAGSIAALPAGVTTDQRGLPRVVNGSLDIGADESPIASLPAPTDLTPSGAIGASAGYDMPTFSWSAFAGADHYDLIVVDNNTGMTPITVQSISGTSYATTITQALTPGHSFTAYVYAFSAADQLSGFASQSFALAALPAPTGITPAGAVMASAGYDRPTFAWTDDGADHYSLKVVDNTTHTTPIVVANIHGTSYATTAAQALTPGHSYTIDLDAFSTNGAVKVLATQTFMLAPLAAPTGIAPSGVVAASAGYDRPTFNWNAVAGADHYTLVVVDNTTGATPIIVRNLSGASYSSTAAQVLTPGHKFTVKVYAYSTNSKSYSLGAQSFTLAPLTAPTLGPPSGTVATSPSSFTWSQVPGANHYYLYVVDDTTGAAVIKNPNVAVNSFNPTLPLLAGHKYTWRVAAVSTNKAVAIWSTSEDFTIL